MAYYGHYKSSSVSTTGCVKEFITTPAQDMGFPPQVLYTCDLCAHNHGFRLVSAHLVDRPSLSKRFDEYCAANNLERDVDITQ